MRADSGRMLRKSCAQRLARDLGERAGQLDAGRPAADDDERQQAALLRRVGLALGRLEREQHPPPHLERIVQRLQSRRARRPLRMAEVGVRRAGRDDQVVVRDRRRAAVDGPDRRARADRGVDCRASASSTCTFFCARRIQRIGDAMSPGDSAAVATWYSSGWNRW